LDIGRLTTGKIKLRRALVPYADVVQRAVESARPLIEARRHQLTVRQPAHTINVDCDPTRISQVIQNLLVNAEKFTPDGGRVELAVTQEDGFLPTSVSDNGRGTDPADVQRI